MQIRGKLRAAYDHVKAIANGGENRETNLQLLCTPCHLLKTKIDVAEKSQVYHKKLKHLGIRRKKRTIPGRKFDGTPVPAKWK
jgi:5-methylcytosine-specific restriction enzyme A